MQLVGWVAAIMAVGIAAGVGLRVHRARQWQALFESALAANQPEVARELIRARWHNAALSGLQIAGAGVGLLLPVIWVPAATVLLLPAAVLICVGVPVAVYGILAQRQEGAVPPRSLVWPVVVTLALTGAAAAVGLTLSSSRGPILAQTAAFKRLVESKISAPIGTIEVTIEGHKAHGCLTGMGAWGEQACGSRYNDRIRFETPGRGFLNVYYVPDLDAYWVFGKARVAPSGKIVENGTISTRDALGEPGRPPR
jgi:hypothetical protein